MSPNMRRYAFSSKASSSMARMRRRENPCDGSVVSAVTATTGAATAGRRTRKIDPAPGRLSTVISPPIDRTMPCEIGRPRPVPTPRGLVVKNESKMRVMISGGMPGPLSCTVTTTSPPSSKLLTDDHVALDARLVERLRGVHDQVQEYLPEARRVRAHRRRRAQVALDARAILELVAQHGQRRLDGGVDVDRRRRIVVGVRERSQIAHDAVDADHPLLRLLQHRRGLEQHRADLARGAAAGHAGQLAHLLLDEPHLRDQRLDVGEHERRRIVDLVRDAGGQHADRRQLLGLQPAHLAVAVLGDVADEHHGAAARDRQRARDVGAAALDHRRLARRAPSRWSRAPAPRARRAPASRRGGARWRSPPRARPTARPATVPRRTRRTSRAGCRARRAAGWPASRRRRCAGAPCSRARCCAAGSRRPAPSRAAPT